MHTNKITKTITVAATGLALAVTLSSCAGSNNDGTYYIADVNGTAALGQLVVEGNTFTHHEYDCEGIRNESDVISVGELNDDSTQVVWTMAGDDMRNDRTGTQSVTVSDTSIGIDGDVYVRDDSDAGKQLLESFKTDECS